VGSSDAGSEGRLVRDEAVTRCVAVGRREVRVVRLNRRVVCIPAGACAREERYKAFITHKVHGSEESDIT
jgi:hypothetical protein